MIYRRMIFVKINKNEFELTHYVVKIVLINVGNVVVFKYFKFINKRVSSDGCNLGNMLIFNFEVYNSF